MTNLRHRIAADSRYTLTGFPTAVTCFALTVAGVAAGIGSMVAFVGFPVLAGTAAMARRFADAERAALPGVLGHAVARPDYPRAPAGAGWFRRLINPLANGQAWMDLLHGIVNFPFALFSFVVTVVWWSVALAGLAFPVYGWWLIAHVPNFDGGLPALLGFGDGAAVIMIFNTAVGALFALTLAPVLRIVALVKANLAQALLTRPVHSGRQESGLAYRVPAGV